MGWNHRVIFVFLVVGISSGQIIATSHDLTRNLGEERLQLHSADWDRLWSPTIGRPGPWRQRLYKAGSQWRPSSGRSGWFTACKVYLHTFHRAYRMIMMNKDKLLETAARLLGPDLDLRLHYVHTTPNMLPFPRALEKHSEVKANMANFTFSKPSFWVSSR